MSVVGLKEAVLGKSLSENGYGVIKGLLGTETIAKLSAFFFQHVDASGVEAPFFTTHWSRSDLYRRQMDDFVTKEVLPLADRWFDDYKCLLGYYLFKKPGKEGRVTPHRDWSLTDESEHSGLILWIPLTDITDKNGGLELFANSHLNAPIRGTNIHPAVPEGLNAIKIHPKAGDAVVMDNRLAHASEPNQSSEDRLAVGLILMPKEAEILHYFSRDDLSGRRTIKVGDDFLRNSYFDYKNPLSAQHLDAFTDISGMNTEFGKGKKKHQTFKDKGLDEEFEKFGYVIVKNFLDAETISHLRSVYHQNTDVVTDKSFFISQWSNKRALKDRINTEVQKALVPRAQKYLNDFEPVFAVFGVKHPKPDSNMYLHQDWAHVDETYFRTVNVWCPLLSLTSDHGPVHLIKGSHRLFDTWRGVDIPDSFLDIGAENLKPYLTEIILEAGDVIMWDHRIIHGSGVNKSDTTRVAAIVNMKPKDATFYLFYADSRTDTKKIEVFEPPADFFTANDSANEPELVKERALFRYRFPYEPLHVSEQQLRSFLSEEFSLID